MRAPLFIALPLLLVAAPAAATGGFDCRTTDGSGIVMSGTIGRVVGTPLISATLRIGDRTMSTYGTDAEVAIARSWIDAREIRVDLVDAQAEHFEAQLRARVTRRGAAGTLTRGGRSHPVRCEVE
jgi:hypothetical protein